MVSLVSDSSRSGPELVEAERRRGLRIAQSRPVKVFEPLAGRYLGGHTQDISAAGLRIALPASAALRPGCLLSIHVGVNDRGEGLVHRRQMIPARVVWIDRTNAMISGRLTAGVEFLPGIAVRMDAA